MNGTYYVYITNNIKGILTIILQGTAQRKKAKERKRLKMVEEVNSKNLKGTQLPS